jgi:5-(carboxyamino)imidazole ribonucleotide synthase
MNIIEKRIGIVGGGQLGKMMILEAKRQGFYVTVLDPSADCPCASICDELIVAGFGEREAYFALAEKSDVITYEFEHINADALSEIEAAGVPVYPSVASLRNIQNKFLQKTILREHGIPIPRLSKEYTGGMMMFKAELGSYDGKGNRPIHAQSDIPQGVEGFFEEWIDFDMEVSVIACRGIDGERAVYPVAENRHRDSILDMTVVPANISDRIKSAAQTIADRVMEVFEGVGTFCVEMFVTKSGEVLVNEVAPRPHNSGHYTIEACFANQFENHIRAIVGLPLGCPGLIQPAVMVNLLGESDGAAVLHGAEQAYAADPQVRVHFYGKPVSKVGRKMGHFTAAGADALERAERLKKLIRVTGKTP